METIGMIGDYIGVDYMGYIGIMEKKMETIMSRFVNRAPAVPCQTLGTLGGLGLKDLYGSRV